MTNLRESSLKRLASAFQIPEPDPEREKALEQERLDRLARARADHVRGLIAESGIPIRHHQVIGLDLKSEWGITLMDLEAKQGTGFLTALLGTRGTGKTQLGTCLAQAVCQRGRHALYTTAADLFMSIRETMRPDGPAESRVLARYVSPSLLVLDAIEERADTAFESRMLNQIIDARYRNLSDTLLISNHLPEAFGKSMGPSIVSRINECGSTIICNWGSFRER